MSKVVKKSQNMSKFVIICQNMSKMSKFVKICQKCQNGQKLYKKHQDVFLKCISQNVFIKMYGSKCNSQNVFLKIYFFV